MNSTTTIKKTMLGTLALAAVAGAGLAFTPNAAHADTSSRPGVGVLKSVDGGQTWADGGTPAGTFTLTFNGQTTAQVFAKPVTFTARVQPAFGKGGGNVEFEWKVEEGESGVIREVTGLKAEVSVIEDGEDFNLGVGELPEFTISKSLDSTSTTLTEFVIDGNSAVAKDRLGKFEIQHLMQGSHDSDGAKGGNVEFEWKVEEGES